MAEIKTSDGLLEYRINQIKNIELKNKGKLFKTNPDKSPSNSIQKPKKVILMLSRMDSNHN